MIWFGVVVQVLYKRLNFEKDEGRGLESNSIYLMNRKKIIGVELNKLDQEFKTLHDYSLILNLTNLVGLTCHLWYLANRLSM